MRARPGDPGSDFRSAHLRPLAALLRAGLTPGQALAAWAGSVPDAPGFVVRTARRARLRAPLADSLKPLVAAGDDGAIVAAMLVLVSRTGGDAAAALDRFSDALESRARMVAAMRAGAAGMRLSGWLVGALPLVALPFTARSQVLGSPAGALLMAAAVALDAAGLAWLNRLQPRVRQPDDAGAALADLLSTAVTGGIDLRHALAAVGPLVPLSVREPIDRIHRQVALGGSVATCMAASGDAAVAAVGEAITLTRTTGTPVAAALTGVALHRRREQLRRLEIRRNRIPVLMVLPLTLCILPAFAIATFAPMLWDIAL